VTILTDHDKCSKAAVARWVPEAHQFHCAHHRCQNMIASCGEGSGKQPLTALWMCNLLSDCNTKVQIDGNREEFLQQMHPTGVHYLTKLKDESQYAAARCSVDPTI
jgi:hypothetical protein